MKLLISLLALTTPTVVIASQQFHHISGQISANSLFARQDPCGEGATCVEACGPGHEICGELPYCYIPTAGETCCGASGKYCPPEQYCAPVEGYCCLDGQNPADCAVEQGFTLPPATAHPNATSVPATTPGPTPGTATASAPVSTYTGAAVKMDAGWAGQALALVVGLGGLL